MLITDKEMREYKKAMRALQPLRGYHPPRVDGQLATVTAIRPALFTGSAGR